MASEMPRALRWFLFVIGVGALIASGIYLGTALQEGGTVWRLLRALMFVLLGLFFLLMYGEHRGRNAAGRKT